MPRGRSFELVRTALCVLLAALYYMAGAWHLTAPSDFEAIVPTWAPVRSKTGTAMLPVTVSICAEAIGIVRFQAAVLVCHV